MRPVHVITSRKEHGQQVAVFESAQSGEALVLAPITTAGHSAYGPIDR